MLSVAVIFVTFALGAWVIGLYLLGVGSAPKEGGSDPLVTVGWVQLVVGLLLFTQVFILVQQSGGNEIIVTLAGIPVLFAIFFTSFGVALITGVDLRPIGNLAAPVGILALLYFAFDGFEGSFVFQSSVVLWVVVFLLVTGFTYGKVSAKLLGAGLVVTAIWGFVPVVYLAFDQLIP